MHMAEKLDIKIIGLEGELEDNKREQQNFFNISAQRNANYMNLGEQFHAHEKSITLHMTKFKKEINEKLVKQDSRLKVISQYKDSLKT